MVEQVRLSGQSTQEVRFIPDPSVGKLFGLGKPKGKQTEGPKATHRNVPLESCSSARETNCCGKAEQKQHFLESHKKKRSARAFGVFLLFCERRIINSPGQTSDEAASGDCKCQHWRRLNMKQILKIQFSGYDVSQDGLRILTRRALCCMNFRDAAFILLT